MCVNMGRIKIRDNFVPTLERLAALKIVTFLWETDEVRSMINVYDFHATVQFPEVDEQWHLIENIVLCKVADLPLPIDLKNSALRLTKVIGKQLYEWFQFSEKKRGLVTKAYRKNIRFVWTPLGYINLRKTAELLAKDDNLKVIRRFALACLYCIFEEVCDLYFSLNSEVVIKASFAKAKIRIKNSELLHYSLVHLLKQRRLRQCMPNDFLNIVFTGNVESIRFFIRHFRLRRSLLSVTIKEILLNFSSGFSLIKTDFPPRYTVDVLVILLSEMKPVKKNIFSDYAYALLYCFLEWPWQIFFMNIAQKVYQFLDFYEFACLLQAIKDKEKQDCDGYDFRNLFEEFWLSSPILLRKHLLAAIAKYKPDFFQVFEINNIRSVKLLIADIPRSLRQMFFLTDEGQEIYEHIISIKEWDVLKFLVANSVRSASGVAKLNEKLCCIYNKVHKKNHVKQDWLHFIAFMNQQTYEISVEPLREELLKHSPLHMKSEYSAKCTAELITYFLPKISFPERNAILSNFAYPVLLCLLESSPFPDVFMSIARKAYTFLSVNEFSLLLQNIKEKEKIYETCHKFRQLFGKFWLGSPICLRESLFKVFVSQEATFFKIFEIRDMYGVKLLIANICYCFKELLLLSPVGEIVCKKLLSLKKWNAFEFLVKNSICSVSAMIALRKKSVLYCSKYKKIRVSKRKRQLLLAFFDDQIQELRMKPKRGK